MKLPFLFFILTFAFICKAQDIIKIYGTDSIQCTINEVKTDEVVFTVAHSERRVANNMVQFYVQKGVMVVVNEKPDTTALRHKVNEAVQPMKLSKMDEKKLEAAQKNANVLMDIHAGEFLHKAANRATTGMILNITGTVIIGIGSLSNQPNRLNPLPMVGSLFVIVGVLYQFNAWKNVFDAGTYLNSKKSIY